MRTIANADHIVVLKDGVVAEDGSPDELIQKNGLFKHMSEQQMLSSNWKM
jgi:ATP-binding cassette subfamily B protein